LQHAAAGRQTVSAQGKGTSAGQQQQGGITVTHHPAAPCLRDGLALYLAANNLGGLTRCEALQSTAP
jgi:hypothetical protein